MNNIEGFVEDKGPTWDGRLASYTSDTIRCIAKNANQDSNCSVSRDEGAFEPCPTFCVKKKTKDQCEKPAFVGEGCNEEVGKVCDWLPDKSEDRMLAAKKALIASHIVEINSDIGNLQGELSSTSYSMNQKLRRYEDSKGDQMNNDLAAEPLKDEQLRFSNYTYGSLIYYPVGCIFLSFLIYKKL